MWWSRLPLGATVDDETGGKKGICALRVTSESPKREGRETGSTRRGSKTLSTEE